MDEENDGLKNRDSLYVKVGMLLAIGSIICVLILGLRMNSIDNGLDSVGYNASTALSHSDEALTGVHTAKVMQKVRFNMTKSSLLGVKEAMFELWLDSLNATAKGRIGNFEVIHAHYLDCLANNKDVKDINIVQNLWNDKHPLPAKAVIIEYDNHYLTYKKNGIIECFPNPLLSHNTSAEPCEKFCSGVKG